MNSEASHSSGTLSDEETRVNEITKAMEEEERAIHEETCKEQQQMMDKVDSKFPTEIYCVSIKLVWKFSDSSLSVPPL